MAPTDTPTTLRSTREGGRKLAAMVLVAAVGSGLDSCVPTRPNDAPLYLTGEGGRISFMWCGDRMNDYDELFIYYRNFVDGEVVFTTAAEGAGDFRLSRGDVFSSTDPPGDLVFTTSSPMTLDVLPALVFVDMTKSDPNGRVTDVSISVGDVSDVEDGHWVGTKGRLDEAPC